MSDQNQIVKVRLTGKTGLLDAIAQRMQGLGHKALDYEALDLGFEFPPGLGRHPDDSPTLAQLVVLARKLDMHIYIRRVELVPREKAEEIERHERMQQRVGKMKARSRRGRD